MLITTLPITPGKHNSFVTLFGPLIAGIFSEITNNPFRMILNTTHSFQSFQPFVENYVKQLGLLGLNPVIECDEEKGYRENLMRVLNLLLNKGFVKIEKMDIVYCDCGVVELPLDAFQVLKKQGRGKYINKDDRCLGCGSSFKKSREEILSLRFPELLPKVSISPVYERRFHQLYSQLSNHPKIISRNHRDSNLKIDLKGRQFNLDSDFCWMVYLTYLREDDICVISGTDTLKHLASAVKLLDICKSGVKISVITHPLIYPFSSAEDKESKYTIEEYLDLCKTPRVARTFLMTGARWSKPTVKLDLSNLLLSEKSVYPKQEFVSTGSDVIVTPENFNQIFNSNKILSLLKIMRGDRVEINTEQMKIKEALLI